MFQKKQLNVIYFLIISCLLLFILVIKHLNLLLNQLKKEMTASEKREKISQCNAICKNTLMETLDIIYTDVGEDYVIAKMPVTTKVHQPDGVLHGGAMVALAESVGSLAAYIFIDYTKFMIRGIEISANHLKSVKDGFVFAKATALHKGRTTQLWDIKITNENNDLVSVVKLSTISLPKK